MAQGVSARTTISPTAPVGTSQSLASTTRSSQPGRTRPALPGTVMGTVVITGQQSSVML